MNLSHCRGVRVLPVWALGQGRRRGHPVIDKRIAIRDAFQPWVENPRKCLAGSADGRLRQPGVSARFA
jgi:hypothetical protein